VGDADTLAHLLRDMYKEVFVDSALSDIVIYRNEVLKCLKDQTCTVILVNETIGFAMIRDDTELMTPTLKRYNITRVYVKPECRGGRAYTTMKNWIATNFSDGDVIGMTEVNSNHLPILLKREEVVAVVIKMKKET
jgi:hypothetical protein